MMKWLARERAKNNSSLIAFWPLLTDLDDHSGGGNHLFVCQDGTNTRLGDHHGLTSWRKRNCFFIDENTAYLRALATGTGFTPEFQWTDPFTVSCWIDMTGTNRMVIGHFYVNGSDVISNGWYAEVTNTGAALVMKNLPYALGVGGNFDDDTSAWKHVVVVNDGSASPAGMSIHVNGRRIVCFTHYDDPQFSINYTGSRTSIGRATILGDCHGRVRLVRFYNRRLATGEIVDVFHRERYLEGYRKKNVFNPPRFIASDPYLPLHLLGFLTEDSSATLYMNGFMQEEGSLPLVVRTDVAPTSEGQLTLFTSGSDQPNVVGTTTLYMNCEDPLSGWMPLFLQVSDLGRSEGEMPLYVGGEMPRAHATLTLHLANDLEGVEKTLKLFLQVDGTLVGGQTENDSLPLFLKRPFEDSLTMVIQGPGTPTEGSIDLVMACNPIESASVDLVIPQTVGVEEATVKMFVLGF